MVGAIGDATELVICNSTGGIMGGPMFNAMGDVMGGAMDSTMDGIAGGGTAIVTTGAVSYLIVSLIICFMSGVICSILHCIVEHTGIVGCACPSPGVVGTLFFARTDDMNNTAFFFVPLPKLNSP